jgi:serine/threonine protein kinase
MTSTILCPNPDCGVPLTVADECLGTSALCAKCGTRFPLIRHTTDGCPSTALADIEPIGKPPESNLPESFGRYKIIRLLGRGGMGSVYLALDSLLKRQVALKIPHVHAFDRPDVKVRFLREAEAAARFHHPSFCPIFDIGEADGVPFLTMAFIDGKTLAETIDRKQGCPLRHAADVARKLAVALSELHHQGIVHRDLKPANIMVDARGNLILMDFGLARWYEGFNSAFTPTGAIIGTPAYMSPEQADGNSKAVGPRSDIYSLGVILYELLTGRRPFEGPVTKVLGMIACAEPAPPATYRPDIDPALESICMKAMAKNSNDRYQSMEEFAAALNAWFRSGDAAKNSHTVLTTIDHLPRPPMASSPNESPKNRRPARKFSLMISGWGFKLSLSISGSILLMASVYFLTRHSRSNDAARAIVVDERRSGSASPRLPEVGKIGDDRKAESPVPEGLENLVAQREGKAADVERARSRQIQAQQVESRLHQLLSRAAVSDEESERVVAERKIADLELELAAAELRELDLRLKQANDRKQDKQVGQSPVIEARNRVELLSCCQDVRAAEVKQAEAQSAFTLQSLRRVERLEKSAAVAKEDLEKAADAHRIAEAELAAKKRRLEEAESQLSLARSQLRASESLAP